ncbi:unnamed protein product [Symbiodinium necroappetens]|uniref:Uncharacterized protein n=1 Tax=Symbiodinium necroappetens TaxID=1628268 RepID=A0A812VDE8_9DINO|nr:unnamed protein product [Symbiodinium necroappetens]
MLQIFGQYHSSPCFRLGSVRSPSCEVRALDYMMRGKTSRMWAKHNRVILNARQSLEKAPAQCGGMGSPHPPPASSSSTPAPTYDDATTAMSKPQAHGCHYWKCDRLRDISDDLLTALVRAVREHGVIVIPDQSRSLEEQECL